MCAIYSGPSCNFPQPREANAFYAASIAYWYIVQSLASGSLAHPIPHSAALASLRESRCGQGIPQFFPLHPFFPLFTDHRSLITDH